MKSITQALQEAFNDEKIISITPYYFVKADTFSGDLYDIVKEYYGDNEIYFTDNTDSDKWGEALEFLNTHCEFIKDIEFSDGVAVIYQTSKVNEFLVKIEFNDKICMLLWEK